jgi:hypothetical protein
VYDGDWSSCAASLDGRGVNASARVLRVASSNRARASFLVPPVSGAFTGGNYEHCLLCQHDYLKIRMLSTHEVAAIQGRPLKYIIIYCVQILYYLTFCGGFEGLVVSCFGGRT